eukprot:TRINITY_DN143558_c0_g1_i1.p1 TRINITY_DN143558_c0_g1~~TRINITY_DN143558_c0_g1_i1.p1  ORF type:complete len:307 (-),score=55.68 TRINITY_DN143558_c0_g1_i1:125-1045(-)
MKCGREVFKSVGRDLVGEPLSKDEECEVSKPLKLKPKPVQNRLSAKKRRARDKRSLKPKIVHKGPVHGAGYSIELKNIACAPSMKGFFLSESNSLSYEQKKDIYLRARYRNSCSSICIAFVDVLKKFGPQVSILDKEINIGDLQLWIGTVLLQVHNLVPVNSAVERLVIGERFDPRMAGGATQHNFVRIGDFVVDIALCQFGGRNIDGESPVIVCKWDDYPNILSKVAAQWKIIDVPCSSREINMIKSLNNHCYRTLMGVTDKLIKTGFFCKNCGRHPEGCMCVDDAKVDSSACSFPMAALHSKHF